MIFIFKKIKCKMSECPHCKKMVKHRKICPKLREIQAKEYKKQLVEKMKEDKLAQEKLNEEIENMKESHPNIYIHIKKSLV